MIFDKIKKLASAQGEEFFAFPEGTNQKIVFVRDYPEIKLIKDLKLKKYIPIGCKPFFETSGSDDLKDCMFIGKIPDDIYTTYVFKHTNKKLTYTWVKKKSYITSEGQAWVDLLKEELAEINPTLIIAIGPTAFYTLTGMGQLLKRRGSFYTCSFGEYKVMGILDPKQIIKGSPLYKYFIMNDLDKAKQQAHTKDLLRPNRNLIINKSADECIAILENYRQKALASESKEICYDIECTATRVVSCIGFAITPDEGLCIPNGKFTLVDEARVWRKIAEILEDPRLIKVGQNISFDTSFTLAKYGIISQGKHEDTMVAYNVMFPQFPKGLDFLNSIYTNEPYYKDEGKDWKSVSNWDDFFYYNAKDATTTLEVWLILKEQLKEKGFEHTYRKLTMDNYHPLQYMGWRGMKTNQKALDITRKEVQAAIDSKQDILNNMVAETFIQKKILKLKKDSNGNMFVDRTPELVQTDSKTGKEGLLNVNSSKQMQEYFYKVLKIPTYKEKGKITCNQTALSRLAKGTASRKGRREASIAAELSKLFKFRGTYLDMLFDKDMRFRAGWNIRGTIYGRLSSSQTFLKTGTNMQNIPGAFKNFLLADDGYILLEIDKAGAESTVVAYLTNDADMIKVAEDPTINGHAYTGMLITGLPMDLIAEEDEIVGHISDPKEIAHRRQAIFNWAVRTKCASYLPLSMTIRQCGKRANHGFNYGLGPKTFALKNEIPDADAKIIHTAYHDNYSNLKGWYKKVETEIRQKGFLTNCFGRKIPFYGDLRRMLESAYSALPQSTIVDMVNLAMNPIYFSPLKFVHYAELLCQNHDSLVLQYPLNRLPELVEFIWWIKQLLEPKIEYNGHKFVVGTDLKVGYNWRDMKAVGIQQKENILGNLKTVIGGLTDGIM